jgi:hypothetical protein
MLWRGQRACCGEASAHAVARPARMLWRGQRACCGEASAHAVARQARMQQVACVVLWLLCSLLNLAESESLSGTSNHGRAA